MRVLKLKLLAAVAASGSGVEALLHRRRMVAGDTVDKQEGGSGSELGVYPIAKVPTRKSRLSLAAKDSALASARHADSNWEGDIAATRANEKRKKKNNEEKEGFKVEVKKPRKKA